MIIQTKFAENKTHVGYFCEITRGESQNQRWTVEYNGQFIGRYATKALAVQIAENFIKKLITVNGD